MKDYTGYTFRSNSNGLNYTFIATLLSNDGTKTFTLNTTDIKRFDYISQLNNINLIGTLEYNDIYGKIDKFLDEQYCTCDIFFGLHLLFYDGNINIDVLPKIEYTKNIFYKKFLVLGIHVINRTDKLITYRLELIDYGIYNAISKISYTNYANTPVAIFDIFKDCLIKAGFEIDGKTFDIVKTNVKIKYISSINDNINDIIIYLFNKLYYYSSMLDDSVKFFFINDITNKCLLFDIKNKETINGIYPIILSFSKSKNEGLFETEEILIASITLYPQSLLLGNIFNKKTFDYDYLNNKFVNDEIDSASITQYMNNTYNNNSTIKYKSIGDINSRNLTNYTTYWNNNSNIYWNSVQTLMNTNSLIFETSGDILRKPGSLVFIKIDTSMSELKNDDPKSLEYLMNKYNGLAGEWFVHRVHHIVEPNTQNYKQVISVMRNFNLK